jgi:acetyl esterase/lipase
VSSHAESTRSATRGCTPTLIETLIGVAVGLTIAVVAKERLRSAAASGDHAQSSTRRSAPPASPTGDETSTVAVRHSPPSLRVVSDEQVPPAPSLAPYDEPASLPPPLVAENGSRTYADIEFARVLGFRPLRMDLVLPAGRGPFPVVVFIHGGAFMFGSRRGGPPATSPIRPALLEHGLAVAAVSTGSAGRHGSRPACTT